MSNLLLINNFVIYYIFFSLIKASAMTSTGVQLTSTSPKSVQSSLSPLSFQHPPEQQMTNDASHHHHHHHVHVPRHQPDVNEYKENDDRLTSTSVFPPSTQTFDEIEHIQNKNERKSSIPQTTATRDEKLSVAEDMSTTSSLPYNRIIKTNDVQSDNKLVSSLNHNISSNSTITAFHSISSDVNSPTRHFIPSSSDQQSYAYGNDESLPPQPIATTTSSSLLMHEQANHANDKYSENKNQTNNEIFSSNNQTSTSPTHKSIDKSKSLLLILILHPKKNIIIDFFRRNITKTFFISNSIKRIPKTDRHYIAFRRHYIIT